ncbi:MAG TPA: winged helix-turn-helix domain-containing protein [Vicinamibacterales bacterium]|nr:winged helix-turn-helix domain-containing protein [Vicinamibacterales bacterium]
MRDIEGEPSHATLRGLVRFGLFELDLDAGELRREGRRVKLAPQPYTLLCLLVSRAGRLVTRDDIARALWKEGTFVDFDQSVNFVVKQVRQALGDDADRPVYVETVPKRGYRFIAPVQPHAPGSAPRPAAGTDTRLHKALWANIVELRLAQARQRRLRLALMSVAGAAGLVWLLLHWLGR